MCPKSQVKTLAARLGREGFGSQGFARPGEMGDLGTAGDHKAAEDKE
jgi:hypothetical protein